MKRDQKAQVIDEIAAQISESEAIYAADYRGLSVSQAAELRGRLREADASFRIVKNTLTLRAADQAKVEQVKELIDGPTAFAFVRGDPALAAKALDTFARQEQVPTVRGGLIGDDLLDNEAFRALARLPGRDQLNAQFAGVVASPLTGLVRGLGSLISGLAIALGQLRDQMPAEAAPAEAAPAEAEESAPEPEAPPAAEEPEATAEKTGEEQASEESEAPSDGADDEKEAE
jgi:large subunit ribosomal protein L10